MKPTLKEYLKTTGQSYDKFGKKVGLTKQRIGQIAKGDTIKFETARKIWIASDHEVRFISLYPDAKKAIDAIKHIKKEDICESIGGEKG